MLRTKSWRARSVPGTLALALVLALAPAVRAAESAPSPDEPTGPKRVLTYAICAISVASVVATGWSVALAVLACGRAILDEPPPAGGA